jgi:hypothetical protein
LLDAYPGDRDGRRTVLDLCCSYGVGGALAKTGLKLDDLYRHYQNAAAAGLSDERLIQADIELLAGDVRADAPRVIGLDVAENAARYAVAIGALDDAFAENLEQSEPSVELVRRMQEVDVITTTGGVGYVTERTFRRLLNATPKAPWVAAFCLRTHDYKPIADALATHGLLTFIGAAGPDERDAITQAVSAVLEAAFDEALRLGEIDDQPDPQEATALMLGPIVYRAALQNGPVADELLDTVSDSGANWRPMDGGAAVSPAGMAPSRSGPASTAGPRSGPHRPA